MGAELLLPLGEELTPPVIPVAFILFPFPLVHGGVIIMAF
jgi:hypothetical protein